MIWVQTYELKSKWRKKEETNRQEGTKKDRIRDGMRSARYELLAIIILQIPQ